jgi:hypothetical protein
MKNTIDFEIFTRGTVDTLIFVDTSDYDGTPSNAIVEILFPDFREPFNGYINPKGITVFTTKSLGFSTERIAFPDGLYNIRFSVNPNRTEFICKNYMKLDQIENKMCKLVSKDCQGKEDLKKLYEIDQFLTAARCTENCNPKQSKEFFKEAIKKVDKETNSNNCKDESL